MYTILKHNYKVIYIYIYTMCVFMCDMLYIYFVTILRNQICHVT